MGKKFIVALDKSTKTQNQSLVEYCKNKNLGYWHWLSNFWLLTTNDDAFTAEMIRDEIREFLPKEHMLIIELNEKGDTWAGFGPSSDSRNMFKWLKNNWNKTIVKSSSTEKFDSETESDNEG